MYKEWVYCKSGCRVRVFLKVSHMLDNPRKSGLEIEISN